MEKHVVKVPFVPNKLQVHYPMGHLAPEGGADCSDVMHGRSPESVAESSGELVESSIRFLPTLPFMYIL